MVFRFLPQEESHNLKLTPKIAGSIAVTLLITSSVAFFVTQSRINTQAQDAFVDKLRKTDGMASAVRVYFSANVDLYVHNKEFKQVKQVPVVVAWSIARDYAESQGMKFSTPSLHPRNPDHTPDDFERDALTRFENDGEMKEYFKRTVVNGQEVMRYAQPVRLTEDCLICHGSPAGAKDPFGYSKEGMKVGDLRGAFVVTAPLAGVQKAAMGNSVALLLLSAVAMFSTVAVVFFLVRRYVVKPVAEAAALATQIAGNNLAVDDIAIRAHDEIGEASVALNKMKNNLHAVIESIAGSAMQVASASEELSATSQLITANSEETSAQARVVSSATEQVSQNLQTVATGAEEMGSTIKEIAKNATEAAQVATAAVTVAEKTTATVSKLGISSSEIGEVVKVITSIAQQTNLLALNATIEAARAGEAGKGFAVVANEVKELAKATAKATDDISRKIAAIQTDTTAAVEAIVEISGVINRINGISNTIATAVEEQNATTTEMARNVSEAARGSGEITSNISGVAEAAESTSRGAGDTQKAAKQLVDTSAELRRLVEQFGINSTAAGNDARSEKSRAARAGM